MFIFPVTSKPGKYGVNVWTLCDSEDVYCHNFQVYTKKVGNEPEKNKRPRVVKTLTKYLYGSGRNITNDIFFI